MMNERPPSQSDLEDDGSSVSLDRIVWTVWWMGTALIVMSWFGVVPSSVGWAGFGLACLGSLVSVVVHRYWRMP